MRRRLIRLYAFLVRSKCVLIAVLATLAFPTNAGAKPVLLLLHPGGFLSGSTATMDSAASYAKPNFQPVEVDYPTDHFPGILRYSRDVAQSYPGRRVLAYGESAGGSIAARLGELGAVKEAAIQAPIADVPTFIKPYADYYHVDWSKPAAWLSPDRHPSEEPVRAWIPHNDQLSSDTWAWVNRDPLVTGQSIPGKHLQQPYRTAAMHAAIDYLASR